MSVPARSVPTGGVVRAPRRRRAPRTAEPARTPARRTGTARARPVTAPTAGTAVRRRSARRFHAAFWGMSAAITTTIVVALVSVSALVVETGFGIDRTEARIAELLEQGETLRRDVAVMSAPGRIAHWAKRKGLEMPDAPVVVLQVRGGSSDG